MQNFDEIIDRRNTNCMKYDYNALFKMPEDVLSFWVADMDFQTPEPVRAALENTIKKGIFGYTKANTDYYEAVSDWFDRYFQWRPEKAWFVQTPGVVYAVGTAIQAYTEPQDAVLIQTPVYYPFQELVHKNNRTLIKNSLRYCDGKYTIDFEDFERKIINHHVKMFILCSPHNPVGRVWTKEELIKMGEICQKNNVIVVSDEIHCDFTYGDHHHTVYASLGEAFADQSVICTAPSKTFNLAGLQTSNVFIPNLELRKKYYHVLSRVGYRECNILGVDAALAAYKYGAEWLEELKAYLVENIQYVKDFIAEHIPEAHVVETEGTYLVWIDFNGLGISHEELDRRVVHTAGLWLDQGIMFGEEGRGFERINVACPKAMLKEAMNRLLLIR